MGVVAPAAEFGRANDAPPAPASPRVGDEAGSVSSVPTPRPVEGEGGGRAAPADLLRICGGDKRSDVKAKLTRGKCECEEVPLALAYVCPGSGCLPPGTDKGRSFGRSRRGTGALCGD